MNIGDRYWRWEVVDDTVGYLGPQKTVKCRCRWGTVRDVRVTTLRNGMSQGCGCLRAQHLHRVRPMAIEAIKRRVAEDYQRGYGRE